MRRFHQAALIPTLLAACDGGGSAARSPGPDASALPGADAEPDGPADAETSVLARLCGAMPATLEDWERCYQKRQCELWVGCAAMNEFLTVEECLELRDGLLGGKLAAERRERERAVSQQRARIDAPAFAQCLIETAPDRCHTGAHPPSCYRRFQGTVPDDGACHADVECQSPGAVCERSCPESCCPGVCRRLAREGEPCNKFVGSCEYGLSCSTRTRTCWKGVVGSACAHFSECNAGAWCDVGAGICKAAVGRGQPCSDHFACDGVDSCVGDGSVITPGDGHCQPVNVAGDACEDFCYGPLFCKKPDSNSSGVCTPLPVHGEPCGLMVGCHGAMEVCLQGTCRTRLPEGADCTEEICQPGLFCSGSAGSPDRKCTHPQPAGADCLDRHQCQSYQCSATATAPGKCLPWSPTCP